MIVIGAGIARPATGSASAAQPFAFVAGKGGTGAGLLVEEVVKVSLPAGLFPDSAVVVTRSPAACLSPRAAEGARERAGPVW